MQIIKKDDFYFKTNKCIAFDLFEENGKVCGWITKNKGYKTFTEHYVIEDMKIKNENKEAK